VVQLNFNSGTTVGGNGVNDALGYFVVDGTYSNKAPYGCELHVQFTSGPKITLTGWRESERNGMVGNWTGSVAGAGSGTFSLAPNKDAVAGSMAVADSRKTQLLALGFSEAAINSVLPETDSIESAIEQLTSGAYHHSQPEAKEANSEMIVQLVSMGFETDKARMALIQTNNNLEHAANLLFEGN